MGLAQSLEEEPEKLCSCSLSHYSAIQLRCSVHPPHVALRGVAACLFLKKGFLRCWCCWREKKTIRKHIYIAAIGGENEMCASLTRSRSENPSGDRAPGSLATIFGESSLQTRDRQGSRGWDQARRAPEPILIRPSFDCPSNNITDRWSWRPLSFFLNVAACIYLKICRFVSILALRESLS